MADFDPSAPNARRYPRVITEGEISSMPRLQFNTGIDTAIFLSRERDDARYFRQGYCYQEPDHAPYNWEQPNFDETHYCLEGHIKLRVKDANDREVVLEAVRESTSTCRPATPTPSRTPVCGPSSSGPADRLPAWDSSRCRITTRPSKN